MTKDINELVTIAQRLVRELGNEGEPHLKRGFESLDVKVSSVGGKIVATVQWPSWRLDLCSFALADNLSPHTIVIADSTYVIKNDAGKEVLISRNNFSDTTRNWDTLEKAPLWMVLDAFLLGEWTPPWRCGFCRDRIKKLSRPKW
jgi:hypothetical protein